MKTTINISWNPEMIIYCAGAIRGNTEYQNFYKEIVDFISSLKHTALSEFSGGFRSAFPLTDHQIFTRDIKWLEKSSLLIAEVSGASTGVGFEISYALYKLNIPVLALVHNNTRNISALIAGCNSPQLTIKHYKDSDDLKKIIKAYIDSNSKNN